MGGHGEWNPARSISRRGPPSHKGFKPFALSVRYVQRGNFKPNLKLLSSPKNGKAPSRSYSDLTLYFSFSCFKGSLPTDNHNTRNRSIKGYLNASIGFWNGLFLHLKGVLLEL